MGVRLDKWLQIARFFKSRRDSTHACELGRVRVNGQPAKPHRHLAVGDRVEIDDPHWPRNLLVRELPERPVAKAVAPTLYADESPPRPAVDPISRLLRRPPAERAPGAGRPTKKERREIERWNEGEEPD
jgi:ribosome-associated heat shock protein Hsp15